MLEGSMAESTQRFETEFLMQVNAFGIRRSNHGIHGCKGLQSRKMDEDR